MASGVDNRTRLRWDLVVLYAWIVIVSLVSLQAILPFYGTLRLREAITVALLVVIILGRYSRGQAVLIGMAYAVLLYSLIVVSRSDLYGLADQIQLFVRLNMFFLLIVAVPLVIRTAEQARRLLLFTLVFAAIIALSAPIQERLGAFTWLYSEEKWGLFHGRGGYVRYLSFFGDPNVGGILGGLLPVSLLLGRRTTNRPPVGSFAMEIFVWSISLVLVAYSLSLTGLVVMTIITMITLWFGRDRRTRWLMQIGFVILAGVVLMPQVSNMLTAVVQRSTQPFSDISPVGAADANFIEGNLLFRLTADLDVNDTVPKLLFGSTYNVVAPSRSLNAQAILAHNGYKEVFLAGGLVGLGLFMAILGLTAYRAYRLFTYRHTLPDPMPQAILCTTSVFGTLLLVMLFFPVYHYNGIGTLFWITAGLIHALHELANPSRHEFDKAKRENRIGASTNHRWHYPERGIP